MTAADAARAARLLLAAALPLLGPCVLAAQDAGPPAAPQMQFVPDPAGTYSLQRIQQCPDGDLIDFQGRTRGLASLTRGKITLLTFFYTHCTDPLGCPFAAGVMSGLRQKILAEPVLPGHVRFVSISFDPAHDSLPQLRAYARSLLHGSRFEWDFLTAPSMRQLRPILDDFGQEVQVEADAHGHPAGAIDHMLKLFLIDAGGTVREIYALDYLQPEVMLNDIRTLWLESQAREASAAAR